MTGHSATKDAVLAVETSGDLCSIALLRQGKLALESRFRHELRLSEQLIDRINELLRQAAITLAEVTLLVTGIGPGSFTGTRIGVATMKALAEVSGIPLKGVGGLDALAQELCGLTEVMAAPLLPCRPGTVYAALYEVAGLQPRVILEPAARSANTLAAELEASGFAHVATCGPAAAEFCELLRAEPAAAGIRLDVVSAEWPGAAAMARLAVARVAAGEEPDDPSALAPLYISPPAITAPKRPQGLIQPIRN